MCGIFVNTSTASEHMRSNITCGSVIKIRHMKWNKEYEHYAIVCNSEPQQDIDIVLGVITTDYPQSSNGRSLVDAIKETNDNETAVYVHQCKFPSQLHRLSFVNCNDPIKRSLPQLCSEVDGGVATFYHPGVTDMQLVIQISKGMLGSNSVTDELKEFITANCKIM